MPAGQQSVRHNPRGEGHHLPLHEDGRALTLPLEAMGKSQTVEELREGHLPDQREPPLLEQVRAFQVQAAFHEDHAVPHPDAKVASATPEDVGAAADED